MRNVDGSPINDAEDKKPGCLLTIGLLMLIPVLMFGKLLKRISRGRYWRMSDADYAILERKIQRQKKREEERKR